MDDMKRIKTTLMLLLIVATSFASQYEVTATLRDRDTKEGIMMATVQLLKADSTFIKGVLTDDNGCFSLPVDEPGKYIIRLSSVGYKTIARDFLITETKPTAQLGDIILGADTKMLKGATILGQAAKVTLKEDTFVYNASAYRTPEGSVVEELVKKLPGAQIDDDGKITINGKEVKKILFDGKEFMTGDTKTAMKNIPTSIIEKVKAYEEKSDLAKVTGIDDGEEQTVLDFGIKKGMNKGFFGNADLAAGTHSRYAEKLMGAGFQDNLRIMALANLNNVGDMGFPGGGGRFGGAARGLNTKKMIGTNLNYEQKGKIKIDGSMRWNHSNGDLRQSQATENFVNSSGAFGNSSTQNLTRSDGYDARFRIEWTPDTMTNIMVRPRFSYSTSDSQSNSTSATFQTNPYDITDNPLDNMQELYEQGAIVNSRTGRDVSYGETLTAGTMLQINRKIGSKGRNITARADISYTDDKSRNLSLSNVRLYQLKDQLGNDSTYNTNRYNNTPSTKWQTALQFTYSEPLWRSAFLQFSYKFTYNYRKSDRATYDFSHVSYDFIQNITSAYRSWGEYLNVLDASWDNYYDKEQSRYSEYRNYIHEMQLSLKIVKKAYKLNAGIMLMPQTSKFVQQYRGINTDTVRNVVNFAPALDFRYKFSKTSTMRIKYRGTSAQPDMSDLLDITDDSDPLNIKKGNPGLKPSFTNNFRLFYNTYIEKHQTAIMTFVNYSNTRNSVSNTVTYDNTTGGRTTKPENINGNWNANAALMFNTSIDSVGVWNVNTFTTMGYNNYVGYLFNQTAKLSEKNTTRTVDIGEKLTFGYRKDWLDVSLDGSLNYMRTRNMLQQNSNLDTWQFSYGVNINAYLPWNMSITTDLHENSRRGFDAGANTNELVWNAQISQSFLKGNALSVSLQFYDILQNLSNFSRTVNAMQRSDSYYNNINSYAMLHVVYRFNLFGGKDAFDKKHDGRRPDGRSFGDRPPMPNMGRGGNFPGGRPQRF